MIKGGLNIYGGLPNSLVDPSNFDCSFIVSIDHFVYDLFRISHDCNFGDLVLLNKIQSKEKRKPLIFVVGFSTKTLGTSQYFVSSSIKDDPTRTYLLY